MGKGSNLLIALLAGAAAGVAIGLLIAPEKGSDSRKNISDAARKLADSLLEKAEETLDKMSEPKS